MQPGNSNIQVEENVEDSQRFNIFKRDYLHYEGVAKINIYLLRLLFTLMFFLLSYDAWSRILKHTGPWNDVNAAAWCMWGSYSIISFIGIMRPLKMLPILLFDIVYKTAWLIIVAYPLWVKNELIGSPVEEMARIYVWVWIMYVAMPWKYLIRTYILGKRMV